MYAVATFVVALLAVLAAFFGYVYTQCGARRERVGKTFADALSAVAQLRGNPYVTRRRAEQSPQIRWELAKRWDEMHNRVDFYVSWMQVEAVEISEIYRKLVDSVREYSDKYTDWALEQRPFERDMDVIAHLGEKFKYEGVDELTDRCVIEMRHYLRRPWYRWR